jgi:hypothetical protein
MTVLGPNNSFKPTPLRGVIKTCLAKGNNGGSLVFHWVTAFSIPVMASCSGQQISDTSIGC